MAIKNLRQRLGRIERKMLIQSSVIEVDTSSHAELARRLSLSRQILDAEREALRLLKRLADGKHAGASYSASVVEQEQAVSSHEQGVAELERECIAAGMTEEEIRQIQMQP